MAIYNGIICYKLQKYVIILLKKFYIDILYILGMIKNDIPNLCFNLKLRYNNILDGSKDVIYESIEIERLINMIDPVYNI